MAEPFSLGVCALKVCASAASILAAHGAENPFESTALALEGLVKGGEAAAAFKERDRPILAAALRKNAERLESLYNKSIIAAHGAHFREQVQVAFANIPEAIKRCLPDGQALARLDHDPGKIAASVVEAAISDQIQMEVFADPYGEARKILIRLVSETYRALRDDPKFMTTLQGVNWAEVLGRLGRIEGGVGRIEGGVGRIEDKVNQFGAELKRLRLEFARERGVDPEVLRPLFDHLGMVGLAASEIRSRADEAIRAILAKASERVAPSNLGADIDAIIVAARAKLAKLDTGGAEALLDGQIAEEDAAFRRRQVPLLAEKASVQRLSYNHEGASATLRRLVELDPDAVWSWIDLGDIRQLLGDITESSRYFAAAAAAAKRTGDERDLSVCQERIGDVLVVQGKLPDALNAFRAGLAIAERLAAADPENSQWQRDLSISQNRIGDVLVAQGNLPGALKAFNASLAIRDRLAAADPGNSQWQRDLSVSQNKIGDVLVAQGKLPNALKAFHASLAIAERLAAADPGNSQWQRDLSVSQNKIGDVLVAQGKLPEALKAFHASLAIAERLAAADPENAEWQRDLSVSQIKIGDVLVAQGKLPDALKAFHASLAIRDRLAAADPGNSQWQRDLSVSQNRIGDVLVAQGKLPDALNAFRAGLAIAERLAAADPGNSEWQRDLSISQDRIGDVLVVQGKLPDALKAFHASLAIRDRLAAADPGNAEWQRDLIVSCVKIADAFPGEARARLVQAAEIVNRLRDEGRLAPIDAWMPEDLARRLAAASAGN